MRRHKLIIELRIWVLHIFRKIRENENKFFGGNDHVCISTCLFCYEMESSLYYRRFVGIVREIRNKRFVF